MGGAGANENVVLWRCALCHAAQTTVPEIALASSAGHFCWCGTERLHLPATRHGAPVTDGTHLEIIPRSCLKMCGRRLAVSAAITPDKKECEGLPLVEVGGGCEHTCSLQCHPGPCPPCRGKRNVTCPCPRSSLVALPCSPPPPSPLPPPPLQLPLLPPTRASQRRCIRQMQVKSAYHLWRGKE